MSMRSLFNAAAGGFAASFKDYFAPITWLWSIRFVRSAIRISLGIWGLALAVSGAVGALSGEYGASMIFIAIGCALAILMRWLQLRDPEFRYRIE